MTFPRRVGDGSVLEFRNDDHVYLLDGHVIPHVTQITDTLCSYAGVPWDVLRRKREIGEAVHYATELDDAGDLDDASLPDEIRGYVEAWRKFRHETGFVAERAETRVYSHTYKYAGTLDRIGAFERLKGVKPGIRCLIDIKTTYDILPAVAPQLAAYARAWDEMNPAAKVARRYAVQLKADASYRLEEFRDPTDLSIFLCAASLLQWRQRQNIEIEQKQPDQEPQA